MRKLILIGFVFIFASCENPRYKNSFYISTKSKITLSQNIMNDDGEEQFNPLKIMFKDEIVGRVERVSDFSDLRNKHAFVYRVIPELNFRFDIGDCFASRETSFGAVLEYVPSKKLIRTPNNNDTLFCEGN